MYNDQHIIIGNKSDYYPLLNNMFITTNKSMELNREYIFDGGDKFLDGIKDTIQETSMIGSKMTNTWSYLGTNCAIINNDFVTNIFMDTDAYDDIIIYN